MVESRDLQEHLIDPCGKGRQPIGAHSGAAGGARCGDLIRLSVLVDRADPQGLIADAGFDARGCSAVQAAGSACVEMVKGRPLLEAARLGEAQIAGRINGLGVAGRHGAELAADALHRALGSALLGGVQLTADPQRRLVALSGGVDSAVAALLCKRTHPRPVAVTVELWADAESDPERSCCSAAAVRGARSIAHDLGLPHFSVDLRERFRAGVVEPWISGLAAGMTPNPCLYCNGQVRIDAMLGIAASLGADGLVTGHYARKASPPGQAIDDPAGRGPALLRVALEESKDQSYALAGLPAGSIGKLHFPLGGLSKQRVRAIAAEAGLAVAGKRDSQDLCFLAGTDRSRFLARHGGLEDRPGAVVDAAGRRLSTHLGYRRFTIGQRRGLGLGASKQHFVLAIDAERNEIVVGERSALLCTQMELIDAHLHVHGTHVTAVKIRSRGRRTACRLLSASPGSIDAATGRGAHAQSNHGCRDAVPASSAPGAGAHPRLLLQFPTAVERTAPGQLACLYAGEVLVGHGLIAPALRRRWPAAALSGASPGRAASPAAPKISIR